MHSSLFWIANRGSVAIAVDIVVIILIVGLLVQEEYIKRIISQGKSGIKENSLSAVKS